VEYSLGGLSFLTRTKAHAQLDSSSVELRTACWYYQDDYTVLQAYTNMLLGGVDMTALAIHRSGKLTDVIDVKCDSILERMPEVKDAAERRLGQLIMMIKQVKEAIEKSSDDGPWVLQWQKNELVLGKYQMPPNKEEISEDEPELELEIA